mmetsp:Transcript_16345/g.37772  ORF Transcript_16345/g.37772 Transcript_16345/m.37772 type:complete len:328 (+) Transcript_16345:129-1112(+)
MDGVREALRSLLEGMDALHKAGGAHGRLNPSYLAGTSTPSDPCCLKRVVCPRGRVLVERSGEDWHVILPAHHPQAPCASSSSPPGCVRRGGEEGTDPSLWYRAPEEQVRSIEDVLCHSGARVPERSGRHSAASAADVWAVGCMLGEMVGDGPLFGMAETEFQLLSAHCDYTGYTYTSDEIEISSESRRSGAEEDGVQRDYSLRDLVPALCDCGYDLLSKMLCGDWRERITMAEALEHEFFTRCQCNFRVSPPPSVVVGAVHHAISNTQQESVYSSFVSDSDREGGPGLPAGLASLVQEHQIKKLGALKRARCSSPASLPPAKRERAM